MNDLRRRRFVALVVGLAFLAGACSETEADGLRVNASGTREIHHSHDGFPHHIGHFEAEEISSFPHETTTVTNGFEWVQGSLYESAGVDGQSTLSLISSESGDVANQVELEDGDFGAGLTQYNGQLYQITRGSNKVLVYDIKSLSLVTSFPLESDGWGLCNSGDKFFVVSNGTNQLTIRDIETLEVEDTFTVELAGEELAGLDELECSGDQIWATITDPSDPIRATTIAIINIDTKEIEATVDISSIVPEGFENDTSRTLSGIALRPEDNSLWLTGRQWPATYEVQLVPVNFN